MKIATDFTRLLNFSKQKWNGLTTGSLADSLSKVLRYYLSFNIVSLKLQISVMEMNIQQVRLDHSKTPIHLLQALDTLSPLAYTLSILSQLILDNNDETPIRIGPLFVQYALTKLTTPFPQYNETVTSILIFLVKETSQPFIEWVNSWLMIPTSTSKSLFTTCFETLDPFKEFFVLGHPKDSTLFKVLPLFHSFLLIYIDKNV